MPLITEKKYPPMPPQSLSLREATAVAEYLLKRLDKGAEASKP